MRKSFRRPAETGVERHQTALEEPGERHVLGVVGLRPTEIVGEPPRFGSQARVTPLRDGRTVETPTRCSCIVRRDFAQWPRLERRTAATTFGTLRREKSKAS
jgi:hypothetical protein